MSEECPPLIYLDTGGVATGGYGHTKSLTRSMVGLPVDPVQADIWLRADVQDAVDAVNRLVTVRLTQHQFDALVDFTFNEGMGNLASSTLLKLINAKNFADADEQFERWVFGKVNGVSTKLPGLITRRAAEAAWFNTGD